MKWSGQTTWQFNLCRMTSPSHWMDISICFYNMSLRQHLDLHHYQSCCLCKLPLARMWCCEIYHHSPLLLPVLLVAFTPTTQQMQVGSHARIWYVGDIAHSCCLCQHCMITVVATRLLLSSTIATGATYTTFVVMNLMPSLRLLLSELCLQVLGATTSIIIHLCPRKHQCSKMSVRLFPTCIGHATWQLIVLKILIIYFFCRTCWQHFMDVSTVWTCLRETLWILFFIILESLFDIKVKQRGTRLG